MNKNNKIIISAIIIIFIITVALVILTPFNNKQPTTGGDFDNIYRNKVWGDENNGTLSGSGSTIEINKYRNIFLSSFINENNIQEVYDICGDCNWQHVFVDQVKVKDFKYFGFDISKIALEKAKENNKGNNLYFSDQPIDLCNYILKCNKPSKSLIIIKEVIQHLTFELGIKMLQNIKKSGIKYIAITNHDSNIFNVQNNIDINKPGGFYPNNMFLEPFNFKNPIKDVSDLIKNKELEKRYGNLIIFNIQEQEI